MIKTIKHKGIKKLFYKGDSSGVKADHVKKLRMILSRLDVATEVEDMNFPGSNLHPLSGKLKGQWSVRVNKNWRLFFEFNNGHAYLVDYDDYH